MNNTYHDDDLVYVHPDTRQVVGKVEFDKNGTPIPLEIKPEDSKPSNEDEKEETKAETNKKKQPPKKKRKGGKKRYYPWGTYRTMKKVYRIEGKQKETEEYKDLDQAIDLAVNEPYWD